MTKLFLILLVSTQALALDQDKLLHLSAGYVVGDVTYEVGRSLGLDPVPALITSFGAAVLAGTLKEAYDAGHGKRFDNKDLAFTVAGGALSCGFRLVLRFE